MSQEDGKAHLWCYNLASITNFTFGGWVQRVNDKTPMYVRVMDAGSFVGIGNSRSTSTIKSYPTPRFGFVWAPWWTSGSIGTPKKRTTCGGLHGVGMWVWPHHQSVPSWGSEEITSRAALECSWSWIASSCWVIPLCFSVTPINQTYSINSTYYFICLHSFPFHFVIFLPINLFQ